MAGVYQIYNKETNKRYIGSSINIERRLKEHKRNLKANRHPRFSPDLSEEEVKLLKDSVHFNREDLLEILNILILNYINLEDILDDQLDRHGTDNAGISDSEV